MGDVRVFTDLIEEAAMEQIETISNHKAFRDTQIRIMPDVHAGKGCVIGFTAQAKDKVIPNIVGVDIGCGMYIVDIGKVDIDYERFDRVIKQNIPSGMSVRKHIEKDYSLKELRCFKYLKNIERLELSLGTLGGGNHFIEIDTNPRGNKFLIIHTGSRNLGLQVAKYYQDLAIDRCNNHTRELKKETNRIIEEYSATGRYSEIEQALKEHKQKFYLDLYNMPKELCYLEGEDMEDYLHDMKICQHWASTNRALIAEIITTKMGWANNKTSIFEVVHNYIDKDNMIRKGAISAKRNELVLIPINMRDGCILGVGKGNPEWNYSAPHGAGRLMSRAAAKENISMEEFQSSMEGIYTTTVDKSTIDEAPQAYKPKENLLKNIGDTVRILDILKPVYNFKAGE